MSEVGGAAERRYPAFEVRGGGREEIPSVPKPEARGDAGGGGSYPTPPRPRPGAATRGVTLSRGCAAQEGLEELSHTEGQEGRR